MRETERPSARNRERKQEKERNIFHPLIASWSTGSTRALASIAKRKKTARNVD